MRKSKIAAAKSRSKGSKRKAPRRERSKKGGGLAEAFDILASMPEDAFKDIKDTRPPERRKGL